MDRLNLANIQALGASSDYGGRGFLQPQSAALGLSAAHFLSDLSLWQGAGYTLTDGEIDDIQSIIADLENDLITTGDMYLMDNCRISRLTNQTVVDDTGTWLGFDREVYDLNDMHDNVVNNERITIQNAGLHLITATINWAGNGIGRRDLSIYRYRAPSFVVVGFHSEYMSHASYTPTQIVTSQDMSEIGDYYALRVKQTSGGNLDILQNWDLPLFAVAEI